VRSVSPAKRRQLARALLLSGLSLRTLLSAAREVVLFGSRATGPIRRESDWDLLCIGEGKTRRHGRVHLVWLPSRVLETPTWLGSELANHVVTYGEWVCGEGSWIPRVHASVEAARAKRRKLSARLGAVRAAWDLLAPAYRDKHVAIVRRELQRLHKLELGLPVPPAPTLDREWNGGSASDGSLLDLARKTDAQSPFLMEVLAAQEDRARRVGFADLARP